MLEKGKKSAWRRIRNGILMFFASAIYAAGVSLFLDPNSLAPGGVTGISIILNRVTGLETGTWILLLNIPILGIGAWKFGVRFIISTIYCTVLTSVFTNILSPYGALTGDLFLAAVAGSSLIAVGIGLVFKAGATTGGMDIIVKLLRLKMPHKKTGTLFLLMDAVVVALSALLFRNLDRALYAGMAVVVTSQVLDFVLYGKDGAKMVFLVSATPEKIAGRLMGELGVGVTYLKGAGAYSGKERQVILCVVRKQLSSKVEEIVKEEDPAAFLIVSSASEIYGEGYKNFFGERL